MNDGLLGGVGWQDVAVLVGVDSLAAAVLIGTAVFLHRSKRSRAIRALLRERKR